MGRTDPSLSAPMSIALAAAAERARQPQNAAAGPKALFGMGPAFLG
jgi:hypothetical protein